MKKIIKYVINGLLFVSFIIYLLLLYYFTIGKHNGSTVNGGVQSFNLIPFKTISEYIRYIVDGGGFRNIAILNLIGNIILLLPMAIYLAYFIKAFRRLRNNITAIFCIVIFIEVVELVTGHGTLDIDDIILNLSGALVGFGIWNLKPIQWLTYKLEI